MYSTMRSERWSRDRSLQEGLELVGNRFTPCRDPLGEHAVRDMTATMYAHLIFGAPRPPHHTMPLVFCEPRRDTARPHPAASRYSSGTQPLSPLSFVAQAQPVSSNSTVSTSPTSTDNSVAL